MELNYQVGIFGNGALNKIILKSKNFQDPIQISFYNITPWWGLFYTNRLAAPAWCPHSALSPGHKHRVSPSTDHCTGQERVRATW